jgi:methyl-accepting chemotaxis protein
MFNNIKLGTKVLLTLGVTVILMIAIGTYSASRLQQAGESETIMYEQITVPVQHNGEFVLKFYRAWTSISFAVFAKDAVERSTNLSQVEPRLLEADAALENIDKIVTVDIVRAQVAAVISAYQSARQEMVKAAQMARKGDIESVITSITVGDIEKARKHLGEEYVKLSKLFMTRGKDRAEANVAVAQSTIHANIALMGLGSLAAILIGIFLFRNIAKIIRGIRDEAEQLVAHITTDGQLSVRANPEEVNFEFRPIVQGFNNVLDVITRKVNITMDYIVRISKGDMPPKITVPCTGDFDTLKCSINSCIDSLSTLLSRTTQVYEAHKMGKIDAFVKEDDLPGAYQHLAHGLNDGLRLHIQNETDIIGIVTSYAQGNFEPSLRKLPGQLAFVNESMDLLRENLHNLIIDFTKLTQSAVEGNLTARADASRQAGDFRKIVEGVNATLNAIMEPIQEASQILEKLAQRDLCARMHQNYQGDHAKIKNSVNATGEALHDALQKVAVAVDQVSAAAGQIASSSQSVSDGASQQASSLEETSSSLETMSAMVKRSAENAMQANTLAQTAKAAAVEGAASMDEMTSAMGKIRASAEGTSQIIKEINEIAFQTNLLALNAAVEAARAGEAGRGFAVVAEEVRSLALRSKEAALKTEELIKESVNQAAEGEIRSKQVNSQLGEIVGGIGKVTDIVGEITASAREQSSGIDQINKAVADVNKVTQQNAANSEESSAAAEELSSQSEELAAMVSAFQLSKQNRAISPHLSTTKGDRKLSPARRSAQHVPGKGCNSKIGPSAPKPDDVFPLEEEASSFKDF